MWIACDEKLVLLLLVSFFLSDFLFIFWIPSSKSCLGCEAKVCQGTWDPGDRHPRNFGLDVTTPCVTISLLCKRQAAVILYGKCRASRHKKTSREVRERSPLRTEPIIVSDDGRTRTLYSTIEGGEKKKKKRKQQKEKRQLENSEKTQTKGENALVRWLDAGQRVNDHMTAMEVETEGETEIEEEMERPKKSPREARAGRSELQRYTYT